MSITCHICILSCSSVAFGCAPAMGYLVVATDTSLVSWNLLSLSGRLKSATFQAVLDEGLIHQVNQKINN